MTTEYQKENARKGKEFEKKQDERIMKPVRDAGDTFKETMSEGKVDTMGNTTGMKKGGKVAGRLATRGYGMCKGGKTK